MEKGRDRVIQEEETAEAETDMWIKVGIAYCEQDRQADWALQRGPAGDIDTTRTLGVPRDSQS